MRQLLKDAARKALDNPSFMAGVFFGWASVLGIVSSAVVLAAYKMALLLPFLQPPK